MSNLALHIIILGFFPAIMAFAATSDLVSMTIGNRLQLALCGLFLIVAISYGFTWHLWVSHVMAFMVVLAVSFVCFARGWIGGGDAKLAACTALWFGFTPELYAYLLYSACFGGALTIGMLYYRTLTLPRTLATQGWALRLHNEKEGIPYGIALAAAALMTYPDSAIFALIFR